MGDLQINSACRLIIIYWISPFQLFHYWHLSNINNGMLFPHSIATRLVIVFLFGISQMLYFLLQFRSLFDLEY